MGINGYKERLEDGSNAIFECSEKKSSVEANIENNYLDAFDIVCNKVPNISKLEITALCTSIPAIIVNVIVIYDKFLFKFLSFFLKIGTASVSAGAYNFIITILNIHIAKANIYLIYTGFKMIFLLSNAFPI